MLIDPTAAYNQQPQQAASQSGRRSVRSIVGTPVGLDNQRAEVLPHSSPIARSVRSQREEPHQVQVVPPVQYHQEEPRYELEDRPVDRKVSLVRSKSRTGTMRTTASRRSVLPENPSM